jgi:hypothetical protein
MMSSEARHGIIEDRGLLEGSDSDPGILGIV